MTDVRCGWCHQPVTLDRTGLIQDHRSRLDLSAPVCAGSGTTLWVKR